jgi:PhoH-like ATPase
MTEQYTGVSVVEVQKEIIDELYKEKEIDMFEVSLPGHRFSQNEYLVVKDVGGTSSSVLGKVRGTDVHLLPNTISAAGLKPKNKEQVFALDALLDDSIKVVILTGRAGTGKTVLTLAAAIQKFEEQKYARLTLTRPMSQVGKHELGILPGEVNDKFLPYLQSYICNLEFLMGDKSNNIDNLIEHYRAEFIPFQLIRGASWHNRFAICDEAQTLDYLEMLTLGTRVGEGSKIVILGDLNQRDDKIPRDKTGIYKFVNSDLAKNSNMVASIELLKCERGSVAALFADIFQE